MNNIAVIYRSVALFAIVYQLRLIADDLADTAVFSATLYIAFAAAVFLAFFTVDGKKIKPLAAIITIGLIPWVARAFIAMPGALMPGTVGFDALLLNFDRNNFVSLLPFYWITATTLFAIRSRLFLRAAVIADIALLIVVFGFTPVSDIAIYRWPIVLIVLIAGIVFLQALALLYSLPPEINLRKSEKITAIYALLLVVFIGGLLFLKPSQERAAQKGGGLLEPKLFSFDFSQFLRLESEISMTDDLVFIVKKDPRDDNILLRRSVMSGYSKRQGFYRIEEIDEKIHPLRLPSRPTILFPPEIESAERVFQEYFIVNFDAAAFIGMKEPAEIIPYESWDSSSFKSAYAVESLANNMLFIGDDASYAWPSPESLGLSEKEFALYTAYGDDERIRSLAEELTAGFDSYIEKVEIIYDWLKYGEYSYSLKPGIAPDGNQLAWFLFHSKKGYCSYYAFAMALMLRSLGIPARVAAGFFIDFESGVFDYYPVRADMAHAWVEVPFPGYGWIEFDPTSEYLAEGEEFRFSAGVDPHLLERLMREILENRSRLRVKMGHDSKESASGIHSLARFTAAFLKKALFPLLILLLLIVFVLMRCGYVWLSIIGSNNRRKAVHLWKHARRRLWLAGFGSSGLIESEWALRNDAFVKGIYAMYLGAAAARFAPEYHDKDFVSMQDAYRLFSDSYQKSISLWRRLLAWVFPPFAFFEGAVRRNVKLITMVSLILLAGISTGAQNAEADIDADTLYHNAIEAEYAEYWERAIELYREGGAQYPHDVRFPRSLGRLYYSRSLYGLAWDEYRKAELMHPFDIFVLQRLANIAGYLNRDRTSVAYLEKVLLIDPDNREAIANLGWMYYKVHRLNDGEQLLLSAIERFGSEADFAMTLATVYSDMYRYDEGKHWYTQSIALAGLARSFVAVAYYNLSILESRFYRYALAMDAANASLNSQNRASGLLSQGELNVRRLELEQAQANFQDAREIDPSPLAKLNLAQVYQISGRLDEARLYALDCLKASDHTWMMHYGIDPTRYKRDIHEILHKTYSGLAKAEQFVPCGSLGETIRSRFRAIAYRFYGSVHRKLYQKYSLAAGDAYSAHFTQSESGAPPLDQFIQYFNAFERYPRRAIIYLHRARDFETAIIPAAEASYNLEEGILLNNKSLIAKALDAFDPVWERDMISYGCRELALAEELFALNRGALLQAGIGLPVEITIHSAGGRKRALYQAPVLLKQALAKAGFVRSKHGTARFKLDIHINELPAAVSCELIDTEGEVKPLRKAIPLRSLSKTDIYRFAGALRNAVFRVE